MATKKKTKKKTSQAAAPPPAPKPEVTHVLDIGDQSVNPPRPPTLTLTVDGAETRVVSLVNLPLEVKIKAAFEAILKRVRGSRTPLEVADQIIGGEWPERRARGTGGRIPIAVRAVARVQGMTEADAHTRWKGLSPEQRKGVQKDRRVKAMVAQIKSEEAGDGEGEQTLEQLLGVAPTTPNGQSAAGQQSATFD